MRHLIGLSLLALFVACGSGNSSSGGGGTLGPESALDYCTAYWNAFAQRYAACVNGAPELVLAHDDPTVLCPQAGKAVAAGRAAYDRSRAGACLSFLQSGDCYAIDALFNHILDQPDCAGALAGQIAAPGQCYTDFDCQSGWCSNYACPYVCVPLVGPGASCDSAMQCKAGYNCSGGVCVVKFGQGTPCASDPQCQPGLYCTEGTVASPATCQPRVAVGAACTSGVRCVIGATCALVQGVGVCERQLGPGESCAASPDMCGPGLICSSATSTCVAAAGPSQSCNPATSKECLIGYCDTTTDLCVPPSVGSSCVGDWDCGSTLTCWNYGCKAACTEP